MGSTPSPTIGLPVVPGSNPTTLIPQLQPSSNTLFGSLMDVTRQFGDIEITGSDQLKQITTDGDLATVTFAPSPQFARHKLSARGRAGETFSARFPGRYSGMVNWLGTFYIESKPGATFLPTAAMQEVRNALASSSGASLTKVIIIPVPRGYGVNVGVKSENSTGGISAVLSKIVSVFIGVGPVWSTGTASTMPSGTWSQQFIVLEEDANGIPFTVDMVTPPQEARAQPAPTPVPAEPKVDPVAAARTVAAEKLTEALARMSQQQAQVDTQVEVTAHQVVETSVACKRQWVTYEDNTKHFICPGSSSGTYKVKKFVPGTTIVRSRVITESLTRTAPTPSK